MKKKLFLLTLALFLSIGFASPYSFQTSCGVWVTTVDPGFFGHSADSAQNWADFIAELDVLNCPEEDEDSDD
jgi:hypothetical protein